MKTEPEIRAFQQDLANGEFKAYFQAAMRSEVGYGEWKASSWIPPFRRNLAGLGALGGLLVLASLDSASAETIACDMKQFVEDTLSDKDDWAYVDALSVRQELNGKSPFAGEFAMAAMLRKR